MVRMLLYLIMAGKKDGKLIIVPMMNCVDYDSGVPCPSGNPSASACPTGWTAECINGTNMCICDEPS